MMPEMSLSWLDNRDKSSSSRVARGGGDPLAIGYGVFCQRLKLSADKGNYESIAPAVFRRCSSVGGVRPVFYKVMAFRRQRSAASSMYIE
jgi:hypothetical protein